jgi:phosphatidate phosphatase PAH1
MMRAILLSVLVACGLDGQALDPANPSLPPAVTGALPDTRCPDAPQLSESSWNHLRSSLVSELGDPHHRGIDLVASTDEATQSISGRITYGDLDKDLEDEDVDVFACVDARWTSVGSARTDDEGRFNLPLTGASRLPTGLRDLYVSVRGDRTGAAFLALVAPVGLPIIVSDVDGTLTSSENEFPEALVTGGDVGVQPGAAETLRYAATHGVTVIYVSTRGDRFTQDTRDWLAAKGFPRGPLRLPSSLVTLPGSDTIEAKSSMLAALSVFDLLAGFGNRTTDVSAYMAAGLSPRRIFIKLPEFSEELSAQLAGGEATGFLGYDLVLAQDMPAMMPQ